MWYLAFIALLVTTLTSASATARERPIRVAVSPFVYLPMPASFPIDESRDAVVDGMQRWVANDADDFDLASVAELRAKVKQEVVYAPTVETGRLRATLGIDKYRELNPGEAVTHLAAAQELFERVDHELIAPKEVSEVLLFHALALLDSKSSDVTAPLDVMKQMVLIDPAREVREGAFPDQVVKFYQSARLELERDVREGGPGERIPKRIAALAAGHDDLGALVPTDYVLVGNVLAAGGDSVELIVWLYDVSADQFQVPASLTVTSPTPQRLQDAANRLSSRLLSCLVEPTVVDTNAVPKSSGSSPFALELNLAYASYFAFPAVAGQEVEPFDNLGAAIGGSLFLTREFALLAMFQFLSSTSEYSGLVKPGFTTLRSFAGGEIGIGFGRFRVALGTLLEGTAVSSITTCPGIEGAEDRKGCQNPVELDSRFLFGVNARPRLSFRVLDSMQVFAGASTSFYFLPLSSTSLNFLTTGEAGLQYRF